MFNPLRLIGSGAIPKVASSVKNIIQSVQQTKQAQTTSQADVLLADAKGESWMQRTWRPALGYSVALILFTELFVVRVINIVLALKLSPVRIDYRELPPEYWVLTITIASVFGGARTLSHIRKSRAFEAKVEKREKKGKAKRGKEVKTSD